MADPNAFLSTIATVSATLVAIIGGLLVARFVSLDSEQQGAQRLVDEAEGRLVTTRQRARDARDDLLRRDLYDFFSDPDVLRAVAGGQSDIGELRVIGRYTPLSDDQLAGRLHAMASEFDRARKHLGELRVGDDDAPLGDWADFKRQRPGLPDDRWDDVWAAAYEEFVERVLAGQKAQKQNAPHTWMSSPANIVPASLDPRYQPNYAVYRFEQRDDLRRGVDRAEQQIEDVTAEVAHLERARDAIIRPKGLGWGLVVLSLFTLLGVVVPLWLMSRAPRQLTIRLGEVVLWLFLGGLVLLLLYMSWLAVRLSGRWRRVRPDRKATETKWIGLLGGPDP